MMIETSYSSILAGHQVFVRSTPSPTPSLKSASFKRRRFQVNRCCSIYKESLTIKMSAEGSPTPDNTIGEEPIGPVDPPVSFEERQHMVEEELEKESEEITEHVLAAPVGREERRSSRDSSEGDLVHVSEMSSINNGGTPPHSGETTPKSTQQQVDLKFERRDSAASAQKPHLAPSQRRDFKEFGYDDKVEDTIQVTKIPKLTKKNEAKSGKGDDSKKNNVCGVACNGIKCAIGIGVVAVLVGAYYYFSQK